MFLFLNSSFFSNNVFLLISFKFSRIFLVLLSFIKTPIFLDQSFSKLYFFLNVLSIFSIPFVIPPLLRTWFDLNCLNFSFNFFLQHRYLSSSFWTLRFNVLFHLVYMLVFHLLKHHIWEDLLLQFSQLKVGLGRFSRCFGQTKWNFLSLRNCWLFFNFDIRWWERNRWFLWFRNTNFGYFRNFSFSF